ncbi:PTS beta-glucoside transporter subunit EIIBCA [Psittacicella gerlachiana]|uniref:protein-N(pi)-phosphohistidine--sucrose phosphotransferase n=1 Tax=Psittacicella gerlachiana TaxID=2028574 RepID=A0A3A1YBS7_9GAMM|nr:PTS beta-glucoside transporter subunit EIIBCA [Psittacicella gerlachiana]
MKYENEIKAIIAGIGGAENIISVVHCATRLRIVLKDPEKADEKALDQIDLVKGTFNAKGQFQIIIGAGTVNVVCAQMQQMLGLSETNNASAEEDQQPKNLLLRFVKILSDIFVPIIPAIVAGGLLMGLYNVLTASFFADGSSLLSRYPGIDGIASMINSFANAPFIFLPVLIAFSASRIFGGNPFLGAAMGMIMVHPDLLNAYVVGQTAADAIPYWDIFGFHIDKVGYQGTVLPVLAVTYILAKIENFLRSITPSWLDNLTTPLIAIIVTSAITFIIVGPVLRDAGDYLAAGLSWVYYKLGFVGGGLFGAIYAPLVITGLHQSFVAIETQLIANIAVTGGTFIFVTAACSNVAQGAATLAVLFTSRNTKVKSLCTSAGVSALLGITEPAMFGVNVKLKYPFIGALCGAALGSAFMAFTKTLAVALGAAGLVGFVSVRPADWGYYFISLAISISVAFVVTLVLGKRAEAKEAAAEVAQAQEAKETADYVKQAETEARVVKAAVVALKAGESVDLSSPLAGNVKPLDQAADPGFASLAMGPGVVVEPTDGKVYAPVAGTVESLFPSKHALILNLDNGIQLLVHVGIDTVSLNGQGYKAHVQTGDRFAAGQLLLEADLDYIRSKGLATETPVVIVNFENDDGDEVYSVASVAQGQHTTQETAFTVLAK